MNRKVILAFAVFAVLLVAVVFVRGRDQKVGIKEMKLPAVAGADVTRIELSGKHQAVLEKDGEAWKVSAPTEPGKKLAVEESAIKGALDAFEDLSAGDFVSSRKEKQAELEVDDEKGLRVKVTTTNGEAFDLVFGKGARGGGAYVRRAGDDDVFIAKGRLASVLRKDVAGWRKRQIFDVAADDIARIEVKPASGAGYAIVAEAPPAEAADAGPAAAPKKRAWKLADGTALPAGFRLDEDALGRIAQSLATLRAQDFAEGEQAADAATGLDAPRTVVEATTAGGEKLVLKLGNEDDKKRVFARAEGDAQVYLVGSYQAQQVGKSLDELRDLTLSSFSADDVRRITIRSGADRVVVEKKDGAFALLEPKKTPEGFVFDPSAAQAQAAQLARLRAARLVGEGLPASQTGLQSPDPLVEVVTADGKTHAIRFGKQAPAEGDAKEGPPKDYYVQGSADALVYAIAKFPRDRYAKPLDLFKKVERPGGLGGPPGALSGLDSLPPDVRRKLEESLQKRPPPAP